MQAQKMPDGVVISQKEIYQLVQEVAKTVNRLENNLDTRLAVLDTKVERVAQVDEKSQKALSIAKNAHEIARETKGIVNKILVGISLSLGSGVVGILIFYVQKGLGE